MDTELSNQGAAAHLEDVVEDLCRCVALRFASEQVVRVLRRTCCFMHGHLIVHCRPATCCHPVVRGQQTTARVTAWLDTYSHTRHRTRKKWMRLQYC